jgi:cytochrome c biogenesis protein
MHRLLNLLSSMKLGLALLLLIAVISVIGASIPQGKTSAFYIAKYGADTAGLLQALLITDLFKSFYFIGLLLLLSLSLLVCAIRRLSFVIGLFRLPKSPLNRESITSLSEKTEGSGVDLNSAVNILRRHHYSISLLKSGKDGQIVAHKGRIGRVASLVVHISFILLVLGGMVGSFGSKQLLILFEGEGVYLARNLSDDLIIYADKIDEEQDPNSGIVSAYITSARLMQGEEMVKDGEIEVNHPLKYQGMDIFQDKMGISKGIRLSILQLAVSSSENVGDTSCTHVLAPEMEFPFPGGKERAILHLQNKQNDSHDFQTMASGISENGTEVILEIAGDQYILPPQGATNITIGENSYLVTFNGIEEGQFTGLTVSRDPGLPFFFAGALLLSIGTIVLVLFNHKKIKVLKKGEKIYIGGSAHRGKDFFTKEFVGLCQEMLTNKSNRRERE